MTAQLTEEKLDSLLSTIEYEEAEGVHNIDEMIWVIDSIYYYEGESGNWIYDGKRIIDERSETGKRLLQSRFVLSPEGEEIPHSQVEYTYYPNDKLKTENFRAWNSFEGTFQDSVNYKRYDEEGKVVFEAGKLWSSDINAYNVHVEMTTQYNQAGLDSLWRRQTRILSNGEFLESENLRKTDYIYNDAGLVLEKSVFDWQNNQWMDYSRLEISYNDIGKKEIEALYLFFGWPIVEKPFRQDIYTYTEDGRLHSQYNNEYENGAWVENGYTEWYYSEAADTTIRILSEYNASVDSFEFKEKTERIFNENNDLVLLRDYRWWTFSEDFVPEREVTYEYNDEYRLLASEQVVLSGSSDYDGWRREYFWSTTVIVDVDDLGELNITVSPNPVSDVLSIDCQADIQVYAIEIYDVLGKKVWNTKTVTDNINMQHLDRGTYFVTFHTSKGVSSLQIVRE